MQPKHTENQIITEFPKTKLFTQPQALTAARARELWGRKRWNTVHNLIICPHGLSLLHSMVLTNLLLFAVQSFSTTSSHGIHCMCKSQLAYIKACEELRLKITSGDQKRYDLRDGSFISSKALRSPQVPGPRTKHFRILRKVCLLHIRSIPWSPSKWVCVKHRWHLYTIHNPVSLCMGSTTKTGS